MLKNLFKGKEAKGHWYHPGIYKFKLPFLNHTYLVKDESELVPVYYCNIEIIVGNDKDLSNGIVATVIIEAINEKGVNIGVTNYIEHIATTVKKSFLDAIFHSGSYGDHKLEHHEIRWIERYPEEYTPGVTLRDSEVKMVWDDQYLSYIKPEWFN